MDVIRLVSSNWDIAQLFPRISARLRQVVRQEFASFALHDAGTGLLVHQATDFPLSKGLMPTVHVSPSETPAGRSMQERLGSTRTVKVKVRVVAATNRNLTQSVAKHEFRSELCYRLNVFPLSLPSLRERRENIPLLIRHFVHKFARRMDRYIETIPKETMRALMQWDWPGNVRELENLMERSVILSEGSALRVPLAELQAKSSTPTEEDDRTLDSAERQHIIRVLRETRGILSGPQGAARRFGLKRTTLQSKMLRLGISRKDYSDCGRR